MDVKLRLWLFHIFISEEQPQMFFCEQVRFFWSIRVWLFVSSCSLTFIALDLVDGWILSRPRGLLQLHLSIKHMFHPVSLFDTIRSQFPSLTTLTRLKGLLSTSECCSSNECLQNKKEKINEVIYKSWTTHSHRSRVWWSSSIRTDRTVHQQAEDTRNQSKYLFYCDFIDFVVHRLCTCTFCLQEIATALQLSHRPSWL